MKSTKQIGLILKEFRNKEGLTQDSLASELELKTRTYQSYESGNVTPPLENLLRIANFYKISVSDLIGEKDTATKETDLINLIIYQSLLHDTKTNKRADLRKIENNILEGFDAEKLKSLFKESDKLKKSIMNLEQAQDMVNATIKELCNTLETSPDDYLEKANERKTENRKFMQSTGPV